MACEFPVAKLLTLLIIKLLTSVQKKEHMRARGVGRWVSWEDAQ